MKSYKELKAILSAYSWRQMNVHVHTHLCDGKPEMTVENIAAEAEKKGITELKALKQQIEDVRHQIEDAERRYDLERLAQLKYGTLPELEKKLEEEFKTTEH